MIPGISYPPSTPKKLYRKVRKTVLIDSRDKNPLQTQSKYTVTLPAVLENVYSVTLRSAEIPFSWYMFSASAGNNFFYATVGLGGEPTKVSIPDGNYTSTTFAAAIQKALNDTFGVSTFAVTYDSATNKLTFSYDDDFSFEFDNTLAQQVRGVCGAPVPAQNTSSWWGLGYFMGFNKTTYTSTGGASITSSFGVQVNTCNYIIMELDYMNKEDETSIDNRLSGRVDGCFAKIPITGNAGDIIFFREWCCPMNRSVLSPPLGQVKTLNIKFRFHDGRLVEFNNIDHSLTLEFELLDNNFDEYSSLEFSK